MGTFGINIVESDPGYNGLYTLILGQETGEYDSGDYDGNDTFLYEVDFTEDPSPFVINARFDVYDGTSTSGAPFEFSEPAWGDLDANNDGSFTYTLYPEDLPNQTWGEENETSFNVSLEGLSHDDVSATSDTDTVIINAIACFAKGTLIATPEGERNVETLKVGDMVTTEEGRAVPVRWIGVKVADPMFNPADRLEPVLIRAGALGENTPHKDLVVTADHGMIVDGHVVDAAVLVGAPGIEFLPWKQLRQTITYYHIETAGHEVVYANSAAAETFIDYTGRQMFDNYAEFVTLYGEENTIPEMELPRISALRQMPAPLRARFGLTEETVTFNILAA